MKAKLKKTLTIASCLLGGVGLFSCVTPLIVSCSNSSQKNVDKYWWPKDVFINCDTLTKSINDYLANVYWKKMHHQLLNIAI